MILGKYKQQPRERIPYSIRYDDALSSSDLLESVVGSIFPADGVVSDVLFTGDRVRWFVSGLTDGVQYTVTMLVTTEDGTIFEDEVHITGKEVS